MSPTSRARATEIAVAAAFAGAAAWLFVEGDERGGSAAFFLSWVVLHVLYGAASGSFWTLLVVLACPPLFVTAASASWLESTFVEAFYGIPSVFTGIVARRLWRARRPPERSP